MGKPSKATLKGQIPSIIFFLFLAMSWGGSATPDRLRRWLLAKMGVTGHPPSFYKKKIKN
jgi:hypothetical protein